MMERYRREEGHVLQGQACSSQCSTARPAPLIQPWAVVLPPTSDVRGCDPRRPGGLGVYC